jgi:hypothetical protein
MIQRRIIRTSIILVILVSIIGIGLATAHARRRAAMGRIRPSASTLLLERRDPLTVRDKRAARAYAGVCRPEGHGVERRR